MLLRGSFCTCCAFKNIHRRHIFQKREKEKQRQGTSRGPFPVIMLSLWSERTRQSQHLMVLFLTGREEAVALVGGIQSLQFGSGDGSFDSVGKELLCIFLLFLSDNGPPDLLLR